MRRTTLSAPEISTPARLSMPPGLAKAFCMSTTTTAVRARSIFRGSGRVSRLSVGMPNSLRCCNPANYNRGCRLAKLPRELSEQRHQVIHGGRDVAYRYALVEPVAESIAVFYEQRAHAIAGDVLVAKPHAVARTG